MKYYEALSKFKKQDKLLKSFVKCFVEDDKYGSQLDELSSFFESSTDIKYILIIQDSSLCMLVSPKHYYLASVLGSQYALTHKLSNIALITPTGETTKNLNAVITNTKQTQMINEKNSK